ncbi:MAG TPA: cell wall metabolism sensor histidine kinase WalK [Thermoanaerobacterales bacterium]|nr:cell wall metabolism sensor histidine kinase WalK [Thermoanaerobacterales bacterium]
MAKSAYRGGGFSLTFRLSLGFTLLITFLMGAVGFSIYVRERNVFINGVVERGWATVRLVNTVASEAMMSENYAVLGEVMKDLHADGSILEAAVLDKKGDIMASCGFERGVSAGAKDMATAADVRKLTPIKDGKGKVTAVAFTSPISDSGGKSVGHIYILTDFSFVESYLRQTVYNIIFNFVLATLAGLLLARLIIIRAVGRPIKGLLLATERVAIGDFSYKLPVASGDELGRLARAFNAMSGELGVLFNSIKSIVGDMCSTSKLVARHSELFEKESDRMDPDRQTELIKEINSCARRLVRASEKLNSLALQFKTEN